MNRCLIGRSGRISSGGASIRKKKNMGTTTARESSHLSRSCRRSRTCSRWSVASNDGEHEFRRLLE